MEALIALLIFCVILAAIAAVGYAVIFAVFALGWYSSLSALGALTVLVAAVLGYLYWKASRKTWDGRRGTVNAWYASRSTMDDIKSWAMGLGGVLVVMWAVAAYARLQGSPIFETISGWLFRSGA
jgi:hypothetical protein